MATGIPPSTLEDEDFITIETMLAVIKDQNSGGKHRKQSPGAGAGPQYSG